MNEFKRNVKTSYQQPQDENDFCDAPLASDDGHIKTHTVLISSLSPVFKYIQDSKTCKI